MKTVIEMAREAGLVQESEYFYSPREEEADVHIKDLERFAELVRADERNATLDEIANKIEAMPFGDTAASFAVWIREQKT
jgi:hypothetical protein